MKTSYLAFKFFKQHWLANILIIAEIIFTLFMATILINRTNYIFQTYRAFENTPISNSIYFMGRVGASTQSGVIIEPYMDDLQTELSSLKGIRGISSIGLFNTPSGEFVISYDDLTASFIKQDTKGSWLIAYNDNGIVVYGSKNSIGTKLNLDIELYNQFLFDNEFKTEVKSGSFEVIGTSDHLSDTLLYTTIKTNKTVNLDRFLLNNNFYKDSTVYFIPADNEIFSNYKQPTDSLFLYLDKSISQQDIDAINTVLDKYGTHMNGKDILNLTYEESINRLVYDLYLFLSIALIAIISLISIAFLNIKKFTKYISIYYINGCSFKKAMCIYLCYLFFLMISAVLLFYLALIYVNYDNNKNYQLLSTIYIRTYEIKLKTQSIAILSVMLMMLIESFIPFYIISRKTRVNLLKDDK